MPDDCVGGAESAEVFGVSVDDYGPVGTEDCAEMEDQRDDASRLSGFDNYGCFLALADVDGDVLCGFL